MNLNIKKFLTKKNLIRAGFLLLFVLTVYLITCIFQVKSEHGINQVEGMYWQPEDSIDVVMMGTSHVHCGINTALLWEKYGIASYDYSGAEQPLWMTYFYLKELYKYQTPEVIVLDMYAPARFKEDYQYTWISENIYGMKFSLNKLEMLSVSVEPSKIPSYFPSFAVYHSRYDDLGVRDFSNFFWDGDKKEDFKGYTPYWNTRTQQRPEIFEERSDGLTEKSEKYLRKIISLTKKNNTRLVLIVTPYIITNEDMRAYNKITEIAAEEGITFINYCEYFDEIGIEFDGDFNDESHLNYWGSCKFTEFLGGFLASDDKIRDKRGEEGYESWDENVEIINEKLESYKNGTLEKLEY
ncbi:MAG: hypothetical protein K2P50_08650 [Lachnospiraceae bacterium]|nr:hypothetical protein [Lachnospiraceae bacterium]